MYYDIMNLYGEYGNVKVLEQHLKDQGLAVVVDKKTISDEINLRDYDFIYMGSGTEKNQLVVLEDLMSKYQPAIKEYIENGKLFLLTGNSYELLGKNINGKAALGIFNFEVTLTSKRNVSDVIATSSEFQNKIVGFVNNMSSITENHHPLLNIEFGLGENKTSKKEGIIYKNIIGTHLIGPLLVRNPEVLEYFVKKILLTKKEEPIEFTSIQYEEEEKGYELVLEELEKRKKECDK